jgi:hypothetical protein
MSDKTFNIALDHEGMHYEGWVTPSDKLTEDGKPKSFHVVLNETMFGNLSLSGEHWTVDEQRPAGLVEEVGKYIQSNWK